MQGPLYLATSFFHSPGCPQSLYIAEDGLELNAGLPVCTSIQFMLCYILNPGLRLPGKPLPAEP